MVFSQSLLEGQILNSTCFLDLLLGLDMLHGQNLPEIRRHHLPPDIEEEGRYQQEGQSKIQKSFWAKRMGHYVIETPQQKDIGHVGWVFAQHLVLTGKLHKEDNPNGQNSGYRHQSSRYSLFIGTADQQLPNKVNQS